MSKLPTFNQWIHESTELDPDRLIELGLFTGPVVEWELDADTLDPKALIRKFQFMANEVNPVIGKLYFFRDLEEKPVRFYLYPSSFNRPGKLRNLLTNFIHGYVPGTWNRPGLIVAWCGENLRDAIDRYAPSSDWTGRVWTRCRNTGEWTLVEPAE
jgi:hypothetical protein